jgi:nicotinate-nucleotide adenylyltransferase
VTLQPRVGIIGGTFDPVHYGHLAAARAAQTTQALDLVRFVPSAWPPHRPDSPGASGYHRLEMVRLAVGETPGWEVSDQELAREGKSYTYDTLTSIGREGLSPLQIFFITGADAFAEIGSWYRYPDVFNLANFVVVARPGTALESLRARLPNDTARPNVILVGADTPNISATDIRKRVARGEPINDLVPPAVSAYIKKNSLYGA